MTDWTIKTACAHYNIHYWGGKYFDVDDAGHLIARPAANAVDNGIDMYRLAHEIQAKGLSLPVLVRFSDILHHRVNTLNNAFAQATKGEHYQGSYTAAYPIKVNQQRSVVEQILDSGESRVGLEAGSKPELMATLALAPAGDGVVICNGYKDRDYVRMALIGSQLGHRVYIVLEKPSELDRVIHESKSMGIEPLLGIRIRLASIGAGKWQNTGGEKAKFGLSADQVLEVIQRLKTKDMLDRLQMMHFHMGSQIANIQDIQRGMSEAARYYAELRAQGVNISCVNVGGGLSVDYEGTQSRSYFSANYSIEEYAKNIVHPLKDICDQHKLPHPDIVTESGRAMTAHHAVLITNVLDVEQAPVPESISTVDDDEPQIIQDLNKTLTTVSNRSAIEAYHDAVHLLAETQTMFNHGLLRLVDRARAEQIYSAICQHVRKYLRSDNTAHREVLDELNEKLADKYFCNFSLFQSMPDTWAINQIFPIVPLHRLTERPTRRVVIQDLTCDSDGRIDNYVDDHGINSSLLLHDINKDEPYLLGIFLIGAYQEILGDMHNLFGDTDSIHVELRGDGGYELRQVLRGDTIETVLSFVHFDGGDLLRRFEEKINRSPSLASKEKRQTCLEELAKALKAYTYLD